MTATAPRSNAMPLQHLIQCAETGRTEIVGKFTNKQRSQLGQYMTPSGTAAFMANMFTPSTGHVHLLDAGAGLAALSLAFLKRALEQNELPESIEVTAYEIDPNLAAFQHKQIKPEVESRNSKPPIRWQVREEDFILANAAPLLQEQGPRFTHAILNPPYRKISNESAHRLVLRSRGIETVNLYSGFVALAIQLLQPGGELVAIIPRSFCNGTYFQAFRHLLLNQTVMLQIHLFDSRKTNFDNEILQENVIIHLRKRNPMDPHTDLNTQGEVVISRSLDNTFQDLHIQRVPFNQVVFPDDQDQFIHIATDPSVLEHSAQIRFTLEDLNLKLSTGPVVDFRTEAFLHDKPEPDDVPLIYPMHFGEKDMVWPQIGKKKYNGMVLNAETRKMAYPRGYYVAVRRFSSKEEKRRIVASVYNPNGVETEAAFVAFENHVNVFHDSKKPLHPDMAYGLFVYLNSTALDDHFRRFSGHTQVNAGDLKKLPYPSRMTLLQLGREAQEQAAITQTWIDERVQALI